MSASNKYYPDFYGNPDWFLHDRFGMFIHWGLYSMAARHEWVMSREFMSVEDYRKYFDHFDPDLFDPTAWAKAAKKAGMKYFVITTKHHDGFCLWDSKLTDYKVTNTPYGKDALAIMLEAFRAEGLKVGLYHSLIDWYHPEFTPDGYSPYRNDVAKREYELKNRDMNVYREYLHGQVRELLTEYGHIDYLWFDFSYTQYDYGWVKGKGKDDWDSEKLEKMVLELQPHILLNDRLNLYRGIVTPEQYQPESVMKINGEEVIWEACQTLNGSWGYHRDNLDWKSVPLLVQMLVDTVSKGGNLLLNVGPNGRGEFDARSVERLEAIGEWMRLHGRSIYGAGASKFVAPPDCRYTQRGDRLYLHLFNWPFGHVHLEGLRGKVKYAQLLNDASEIKLPDERKPSDHLDHVENDHEEKQKLTLALPIQRPNVAVPVIELFLK